MLLQEVFKPAEENAGLSDAEAKQWRMRTYGEDPLDYTNMVEPPAEDMSGLYNTQLSDEEEAKFQQWAKANNRERDVVDYDLRGAWRELQSGEMSVDERGHLGDKYKKPNHPTFSTQSIYDGADGYIGGEWSHVNGRTIYRPGRKLSQGEANWLRGYFEKREPGVILDLDGLVQGELPTPKNPVKIVGDGTEPGVFDGMGDTWKAIPSAALQTASTMIDSVGDASMALLSQFGSDRTKEWWKDQRLIAEQNARDIRAYNATHFDADPFHMGTAAQIVHGLLKSLPKVVGYTVVAGPAGGALLFGAEQGMDTYGRLVDEGVDKNTAINAGLVSFGLNAVGVRAPAALSAGFGGLLSPALGTRAASTLYGVGINVGTELAEVEGIKFILEHQNYGELAKQYELNGVDMAVSAALGAAFGAAFYRSRADLRRESYYKHEDAVVERYRDSLIAAGQNFRDADAQARMNGRVLVHLAMQMDIPPERVLDLAPRIEATKDSRPTALNQHVEGARSAEEKLQTEAREWGARIDALTAKPTQPILMLRQTPVAMHLVGADFRELHVAPHVFDGMFPGSPKTRAGQHEHPAMTADVLTKIPGALADPVAILERTAVRRGKGSWEKAVDRSFVFVLDVRDANGDPVIVPVTFGKGDGTGRINEIKTAYGKESPKWLEERLSSYEGSGYVLRYQNSEKTRRLIPTSGSNSLLESSALKTLSNESDSVKNRILTEADLVKEKTKFPDLYQTARSDRATERYDQRAPEVFYQAAYHGTPHVFDKFTLDHIGTGEGAQAHGWGLYFALEKDVAEGYRERLSNDGEFYLADGSRVRSVLPSADPFMWALGDVLFAVDDDLEVGVIPAEKIRAEAKVSLATYEASLEKLQRKRPRTDQQKKFKADDIATVTAKIEALRKLIENPPFVRKGKDGRVIQVDIPEDDVMLREEATKEQQPEQVVKAIDELFSDPVFPADRILWNELTRVAGNLDTESHDLASALGQKMRIKLREGLSMGHVLTEEEIAPAIRYLEELAQQHPEDERYAAAVQRARALVGYRAKIPAEHVFDSFERSRERGRSWRGDFDGSVYGVASKLNGRDIYKLLASMYRSPRMASELLREKGVLGVRYDGRRDGECAVVWDEESVRVMEYLQRMKEQRASADGGDEIRGSYAPSENTIRLTPLANLTTFSHEHAHFYLETVMRHADDPDLDPVLKECLDTLFKTFGIDGVEGWRGASFEQRSRFHERFAAWTEAFLGEGKVPSPGLAGLFQRFARWIMDMYRDMVEGPVRENEAAHVAAGRYEAQFGEQLPPLSEEVRGVLRNMYGAEKQAQAIKSNTAQTVAARAMQTLRANEQKITKPLKEPRRPDQYGAAAEAQKKAAEALNRGDLVDVTPEAQNLETDDAQLTASQNAFARAFQMGDSGSIVVLQNRDRTGVVSIGQMNSIAADPRYGLLSFDRSTGSGAPIVSFGSLPPSGYQGRTDIVIDSNGDKIPVTYAVVEAEAVQKSNLADGTPNAAYGADPSQTQVIAGNGRMAGVTEAYARGTAEQYRQDLIDDADTTGVKPEIVRSMKHPVLVRFMPPEKVTTGFIERSNSSAVLSRSALETAVQDAPKVRNHMGDYDFDENGEPTGATVRQFLQDIGEPNALGTLITSDGRPTQSALTRLRAALFFEAYRDRELTALIADDTDKQGIKKILDAMAAFAPHVINIRSASEGRIDLGPVLVEVVNRIRKAREEGGGVDPREMGSLFADNPVLAPVLDFVYTNRAAVNRMMAVLKPFAQEVQSALQASDGGMFGDEAVKTIDAVDAMRFFRKAQNDAIDAANAQLSDGQKLARLPDIDEPAAREQLVAFQAQQKNEMAGARAAAQAKTERALAEAAKPAAQVGQAIAETVAEDAGVKLPEADMPPSPNEQALIDEALAHEQAKLGEDSSDRARLETMAEETPDRLFSIELEDGRTVAMTAQELLDDEARIDAEAEQAAAAWGTGIQCVLRNNGL